MKLTELFDVSPAKLNILRERIARLAIHVEEIEESFARGSGKGGQKINKTSSRVQLYYPHYNIRVSCQRERRRSINRFLALRELVDHIEMKFFPELSERLKEMNKQRRRKSESARRARRKYAL